MRWALVRQCLECEDFSLKVSGEMGVSSAVWCCFLCPLARQSKRALRFAPLCVDLSCSSVFFLVPHPLVCIAPLASASVLSRFPGDFPAHFLPSCNSTEIGKGTTRGFQQLLSAGTGHSWTSV